jgi:membrane protein DedA with SNARE-associated domain
MATQSPSSAANEWRECSRWYFLGCVFWIAIFFLFFWFAGGVGEISPEFALVATITIGVLAIGALIIYSVQALRKTHQDQEP